MRGTVALLFGLLFLLLQLGCQSLEHSKAVKEGDVPWYSVTITSPDFEIQEGEMNIYKLFRKADSLEGQREKLEADKSWGEGHKNIETNDSGLIIIRAKISQDASEPKVCIFQMRAFYGNEKEPSYFTLEVNKADRCEKSEFKNPYLSGRIQIDNQVWTTLDFGFRQSDSKE